MQGQISVQVVSWRRRPRWPRAVVLIGVPVLFVLVTARLFVWPSQEPFALARADAIVVLDGAGPRLEVALRLARRRAAPIILLSVPSVQWNCPHWSTPGVRVVCFVPVPATTRGEAQFAAAQARAFGWKSLIVVSSVPQDTRARLRVERCFRGQVEVVTAEPAWSQWPYQVVYEWGALLKALLLQRGC